MYKQTPTETEETQSLLKSKAPFVELAEKTAMEVLDTCDPLVQNEFIKLLHSTIIDARRKQIAELKDKAAFLEKSLSDIL